MAQFNYRNEIISLATIDGPLTRGPPQRFAKKNTKENINPGLSISSINQSVQKLSVSGNQSYNNSVLSTNNKTPTRNDNKSKSKSKSPGNV